MRNPLRWLLVGFFSWIHVAAASPEERGIEVRDPSAVKAGYVNFMGTLMAGAGLRFNNPYRLATPLGDSAESVSRTATYGDLGFGIVLGNPAKFLHGGALRVSFALEGVTTGCKSQPICISPLPADGVQRITPDARPRGS